MTTRAFVMGAMILALSACSPDSDFRATAEHNVARQLKDPDSAKFLKTFVVRKAPDNNLDISRVAACGTVDGKNSFGAYNGGARFVVQGLQGPNLLDISTIEIDDLTDQRPTADSRQSGKPETLFEKLYWNVHCVDDTHPPSYTARLD